MTSHHDDRPRLFLATPTADGADGPGPAIDGSEEAMRRLRDPFAVDTTRPSGLPAAVVSDSSGALLRPVAGSAAP